MKRIVFFFFIISCSSGEDVDCTYELKTNDVTNITESSAILSGLISVDSQNCDNLLNNTTNTKQGFVYSKEIQPTVDDTQVNVNGSSISKAIEGLEPNTTYYVRTFLTNALGEFYGNEVSFTTASIYKFILTFTGNKQNQYCAQSVANYWYYQGNYSFDGALPSSFGGEGRDRYTWITEDEKGCSQNLSINIDISSGWNNNYMGMILEVSLTIINISSGETIVDRVLDDLYVCPNSSITSHSIIFSPQNNSLEINTE